MEIKNVKSANDPAKIEGTAELFSTSSVSSRFNRCVRVRPLFRNTFGKLIQTGGMTCEENCVVVEKRLLDYAPGQRASSQCHVCEAILSEQAHS